MKIAYGRVEIDVYHNGQRSCMAVKSGGSPCCASEAEDLITALQMAIKACEKWEIPLNRPCPKWRWNGMPGNEYLCGFDKSEHK